MFICSSSTWNLKRDLSLSPAFCKHCLTRTWMRTIDCVFNSSFSLQQTEEGGFTVTLVFLSQVTCQQQRDDDQTAEAAGWQVQRHHRAGGSIPPNTRGEQTCTASNNQSHTDKSIPVSSSVVSEKTNTWRRQEDLFTIVWWKKHVGVKFPSDSVRSVRHRCCYLTGCFTLTDSQRLYIHSALGSLSILCLLLFRFIVDLLSDIIHATLSQCPVTTPRKAPYKEVQHDQKSQKHSIY